jgi:hypothetical protein
MPHPPHRFAGWGTGPRSGSVCSMKVEDLASLFALVCGVLLVLMAA